MNDKDCLKEIHNSGDVLKSPGYLLWRLTNLWQKFINDSLNELDLTHVQFGILKGLFSCKDSRDITQIELAKILNTNVMMTSEVLRTLEKKGFVKRVPHSKDTRAKCVMITESGEKVIKKALEVVQKANNQFFQPIEKDMDKAVEMFQILIRKNSHE